MSVKPCVSAADMKPPAFLRLLVPLFAVLASTISVTAAGLPTNLDEAETFARKFIAEQLYHEHSLVTRDSFSKMRHERNETGTAATFFLPRYVRTGPEFTITVVMQPVNAPLSLGHQRAHQLVQRHRFTDYANHTPYATQSEEVQRALPCLGAEAACIHTRMTKRRADAFATGAIEIAWIPGSQDQFGLLVVVGNLNPNVRADANIGSDAFHMSIDAFCGRVLAALLDAGEKQGLISGKPLQASRELFAALSAYPHIPPTAAELLGPAVPPRPFTVSAATPAAETVALPPPAPRPPPVVANTPPPAPTRINLTSEQVLEHAIRLQLIGAVPSPTPAVSMVLPAADPPLESGPVTAFAGLDAPAAAAAPDVDHLLGLLFAPDVRLLVTKTLAGVHSVSMFVQAKDEWAAVVVETTEGFHLPLITPKREFPAPFAAFLKLDRPRPAPPEVPYDFAPLRLFVLRALFELDTLVRQVAGPEAGSLAAFSTTELTARLDAPETQQRLEHLPAAAQWEVQTGLGNAVLLGLELTALRQHALVRREVRAQTPTYRLTPAGRQLAQLLFAPAARLQVTRTRGTLAAPRPTLHPVNAAHFFDDRTLLLSHRPDGQTRARLTAWRGGASVWDLFFLLTEPET